MGRPNWWGGESGGGGDLAAGGWGRVRVFGSMGPGGNREDFLEQARALAEGGVDGLVLETMSDLAEARVVLGAVRVVGLLVVVSMVLVDGGVTPGGGGA